jgi:hypothetical protein
MSLESVDPPKPISEEYIIEVLRGVIEKAFQEKILYIDISYKTDKDKKLYSYTFGGTNSSFE